MNTILLKYMIGTIKDISLLPPLPEEAKHIFLIERYNYMFGYAALPDGTILTCKPIKTSKSVFLDHWRIKNPYLHKQTGYLIIKTKLGCRCMTERVHQIIGNLFIENQNNLPILNHKDTVKTNNNSSNLEWCTYKHNSVHAIENNLRNTAKGEKISSSILKELDIISIFEFRKLGWSHKNIAEKFKVNQSVISRILNRKSWKHISIPNI